VKNKPLLQHIVTYGSRLVSKWIYFCGEWWILDILLTGERKKCQLGIF